EPNCVSTASLNWRRTAGGLCWTIESLPGLVTVKIACAKAAGAAARATRTTAAATRVLLKALLRSAGLRPAKARRSTLAVSPGESRGTTDRRGGHPNGDEYRDQRTGQAWSENPSDRVRGRDERAGDQQRGERERELAP